MATRSLPAVFEDLLWAFVGLAGLFAAGALWIASRRRYRDVTARLMAAQDRPPMPGAVFLALVAGGVGAAGILAAFIVLTHAVT